MATNRPETYDRTHKHNVRARLFSGLAPVRSLVTLPGAEILCIKKMHELGLLTPTTHHLWVERDPARAAQAQAASRALGLRPEIIVDDVRRWRPTRSFDFLNLDMEEGFTPYLGRWLAEQASVFFEADSILMLTLAKASRNRMPARFYEWFVERIAADPTLRDARDNIIVPSLNHDSEPLATYIVMLGCALNRFHVTIEKVEDYGDETFKMVAFRARLKPIGRPVLPCFVELLNEFQKKYEKATWFRRARLDEGFAGAYSDSSATFIRTLDVARPTNRKIDYQARGWNAAATKKEREADQMDEAIRELVEQRDARRREAAALRARSEQARLRLSGRKPQPDRAA